MGRSQSRFVSWRSFVSVRPSLQGIYPIPLSQPNIHPLTPIQCITQAQFMISRQYRSNDDYSSLSAWLRRDTILLRLSSTTSGSQVPANISSHSSSSSESNSISSSSPSLPGVAVSATSSSIASSQLRYVTTRSISRMNFPTLYFWPCSLASTYFQPSFVEHDPQLMSATTCHPVTSWRFSLLPTRMLLNVCAAGGAGGATRNARPYRPVKPLDMT